jgi:hypothetical protein
MRNPISAAATVGVVVLLIWGTPIAISTVVKLLTGSSEAIVDGFAGTSSLFTGLALAGLVASLLIQQQQMARAAELQRDTARLAALPVLLADVDRRIQDKREERNRASSICDDFNPAHPKYLEQLRIESDALYAERAKMMRILANAARLNEA